MDIICAKCERHFSCIEEAKAHQEHCKKSSSGETIRWVPEPNTRITHQEWNALMKALNSTDALLPPTNSEPTELKESDSHEITLAELLQSSVNPAEKEAVKKTSSFQICPSCKQKTLVISASDDRYACLNDKCGDSFFRTTIDKINQQIEAEKRKLDEIEENGSVAWVGNQYYDPKRKKWRNGRIPRRIGIPDWILWIVFLILMSFAGTLILNYFRPGSTITFFGW